MSLDVDSVYGMPLAEWRGMYWWPEGTEARIHAGQPGHEREIVVNFEAYDHDTPINDIVFTAFVSLLPESWSLENRGSRIEIHPSGRFAGGFNDDDVAAVRSILPQLGFTCPA